MTTSEISARNSDISPHSSTIRFQLTLCEWRGFPIFLSSLVSCFQMEKGSPYFKKYSRDPAGLFEKAEEDVGEEANAHQGERESGSRMTSSSPCPID